MSEPSTVLSDLCKMHKKHGLYISCAQFDCTFEEFMDAAPYLRRKEFEQILYSSYGYIICDSKEEMLALYQQTVGDDGPTIANPYSGPCRVYAMTCGPNGEIITENT
jgi:hypothetical protein